MTQDEIMEMWNSITKYAPSEVRITEFAHLVAAKEREACAEVCNKHANVYALMEQNPTAETAWAACIDNRDEIKARGQA